MSFFFLILEQYIRSGRLKQKANAEPEVDFLMQLEIFRHG